MVMKYAAAMAVLVSGLMSGAAEAAPLRFSFTADSGLGPITFETVLDSNPTPDFSDQGVFFELDNINYRGSSSEGSFTAQGDLQFGTQDVGGGFQLLDTDGTYEFGAYGTALFTGPTDHPAFRTGSFELTGGFLEPNGGIDPELTLGGTLVISSVPLPATAPMFGTAVIALGALGYGLKRRGKAAAAA